jgi:glyceraldehyde 3-phosphate dehydrogenase
MIPTSTGAAKAIGLVLPELKGKLDGVSIRVPTPNVSVVDLKFVAKRKVTRRGSQRRADRAADGPLKGILAYTRRAAGLDRLNHDPHSSTFALDQTKVIDGNLVRVLSWYDNEWGFSNRMADTAVAFGKEAGRAALARVLGKPGRLCRRLHRRGGRRSCGRHAGRRCAVP